jgi:uncharacterized membrane protein YoaT (DUF817 family)
MVFIAVQAVRFVLIEAKASAFAVLLFCGVAASTIIRLPLARYDTLLLYAVTLTLLFWAARLESTGEIGVIAVFHLIGLLFEFVKVRMGSWSYPEHAYTKFWGVPLYSGFLYAAVASYICRAWRMFQLRLSHYRKIPMALLAAGIYANFICEYWIPDLRDALAVLLIASTWRTSVHFTVGPRRYRMPLALTLTLIGFLLWVAENMATYLGAWRYPYQIGTWQPVHAAKFGSWTLLVTVTFTIIATWQNRYRQPKSQTRAWCSATSRAEEEV